MENTELQTSVLPVLLEEWPRICTTEYEYKLSLLGLEKKLFVSVTVQKKME